jgi:MFS transporter, ACS family, glucarate transporter
MGLKGRLRWRIMYFIIFPLTFFMSLDRTNMIVSAPIIQQHFKFSLVDMSLILTSFAWTYALLQIPGGLLSERWGSRKTLAMANLWWSIWTVLTVFGNSVATFVGIRSLLGVGQAADWPASVNSIKRWFPKQERARANSILLGGLYLGPIIGTPLTVEIVKLFGWEWSFYIYGVAGAIMGVLWWYIYRDRPQDHPRISKEEVTYIEAGYDLQTPRDAASWRDWKHFISNYRFWALGLQYFFLVLIQSFYNTWLPTYLMKDRGFSLSAMGYAASLPWIAMFIMVFVTGVWQDKILARTGSKLLARTPFAVTGFILSAGFLIIGSQITLTWLMMICFMLSLGALAMVQVSIWPSCTDLGGNMTGSLTGWTNFWGNLSGALGPIATAMLVSLTSSWGTALLIMGLAALTGAALWLVIHPERPLQISTDGNTHTSDGVSSEL